MSGLLRKFPRSFTGMLAMLAFVMVASTSALWATTVYNSVPAVLDPNYPSQPYQAQQTFEFGDFVHLAGTARIAQGVTITMSDWALEATPANVAWCSANPGKCSAAGWQYPFTLNIYAAGPVVGGLRTTGALLGSVTQTKTIPWRPVADPTCPGGTAWRAPDTFCYNGYAFNMTFDLTNYYLNLPNDVIVGLAFNTQSYGVTPTGVDGPYNSLNVSVPPGNFATTGTDDDADRVFWDTITAGWYADGGAGGVGIFREDTAWTLYGTVPIQINAVDAPVANIVNVGAGSLTATPNYTQWFWWNDETDVIDNSLGSFVTGPGAAPYGTGSAQTSVSGTQRRNLATYQFAGTPLASIGTLRYSTYNPSAGNGGSASRSGFLQFNVDFNGSDTWQRRILFLPSDNGTVIQDAWQEWDTIGSGTTLWRHSGAVWPGTAIPGTTPRTWNDILTSYPGIRIRVTDSWLGVRVGEPYPDGYTENIDGLNRFSEAARTKAGRVFFQALS